MPLLKLETSIAIPEDKRHALLASLSKAVAGTTGKPEQYVMVTVSQAAMLMSGKPGDAAFVDIRGIGGLTSEVNRKLSQQVCKLLMQCDSLAPQAFAALAKFGRAVFAVHRPQIREERASLWQTSQNLRTALSEFDQRRFYIRGAEAGQFLSVVTNSPVGPVNIFSLKVSDIGLGATQFPA